MNQPAHPSSVEVDPARFTAAEFAAMVASGAFADMTVELIDGELHRMDRPMSDHGARQASVTGKLWTVFEGRAETVLGETGIGLADDTFVACDVAVLCAPIDANRLLVPADLLLVVEIAETTLDRDTGLKRRKYAAAGIAHYWVVDGTRAVVHVYRDPVAGDYAEIVTVRFGEPLAVPGTDAAIRL
ncbi:Uma2 family endonuclease [Sphingomonas oligophenolica]|nr:Uma2 family endonuclease [Sphingomonas oligophenolica]